MTRTRAKKHWLLPVTITAGVVAASLIAPFSMAAELLQLQVNVVPFSWKVNDRTFESTEGYKDGAEKLPASLNYKGTTYIPIRLLAETLGYQVTWNDATKTATIANAAAGEDDPISDIPVSNAKSVSYIPNPATLTKAAMWLAKPDAAAAKLGIIPAGTHVSVTKEENADWLQISMDGQTGFIPASAAAYRRAADRPAWEQKADAIIAEGLRYLGAPYEFGASTKQTATFDCSSFLKHIFAQEGYTLPRDSRQQSRIGSDIKLSELRKGDLIFFTTPQRKNKSGIEQIGHVSMYLGDNLMLHTFRVGIGVTVTELDSNWTNRIVKVKRILE
ncbi:NlpC/P60 family protein [Paenibacillus sp. GD4]|jgi:cell wall-associated NlpC family hydrolase|uniref:NlpC/P60 family protein n=1 Tax=Paenibacillus sp. GD4 TaxID=3068890 RepID=UPI0027968347|nr:NlpC/P60 family protein [Paenibacillus sp. GD4]MDQ1911048.1 NlpC/P60 family protein [Paenibacillus sp. GD4]